MSLFSNCMTILVISYVLQLVWLTVCIVTYRTTHHRMFDSFAMSCLYVISLLVWDLPTFIPFLYHQFKAIVHKKRASET